MRLIYGKRHLITLIFAKPSLAPQRRMTMEEDMHAFLAGLVGILLGVAVIIAIVDLGRWAVGG